MSSYEEAMAAGVEQYRDVLDQLAQVGLPAVFTQTGGMCAALEIRLEGGRIVLITDYEDTLAWDRSRHRGWSVGLYPFGSEYDDGPLAFDDDPDGSPEALLPLVRRVLVEPPQP